MRHCTVCGAEAREGAKFCTSCGARLQPTGTDTSATTSQTDTLPSVTDESTSATGSPSEPPAAAEAHGPERSSPGETVTYVPDRDEPVKRVGPADTSYVASWPSSDESTETDEISDRREREGTSSETGEPANWAATFASPDPAQEESGADDSGSGWIWAPTQEETGDDSNSDGNRGEEQRSEGSWSWEEAHEPAVSETDAVGDTSQASTTTEDDRHGASAWESWAPAADGASILHEHGDDPVGQIRGLLNELAERIDRLANPATIASRDVDPDDLADQLDRWARTVPDTGELLDVVRDVRKSPRDLDAITRLVDHAGDLELLVRHYQSITSSSRQWSTNLRRARRDHDSGVSS